MVMRLIQTRRFHSFIGYIYLNTVLWIAAPTGLLISSASKGGFWAATGFLITGIYWWISTWLGYQTIQSADRKRPRCVDDPILLDRIGRGLVSGNSIVDRNHSSNRI